MRLAAISLLLPLVVVAFLPMLGGCASRQAIDPRHHFEAVGPLEVDVESFGGDVTITADDRKSDVVVQVVRRAVHGQQRSREARASLDEIDYSVHVEPGELGNRLIVRTSTTHDEPHYQRANVHITAPDISDVYVRTKFGEVKAQGIEGKVDIRTDGDVRVMTNRAMTQPVTIITRDGTIDYRVRGESAGSFDCASVHGEVRRRVHYGRFIAEPDSAHNRMYGRLNDGTNLIQLRTVYGDIRIAVIHNPEQVGQFMVD